MGGIIPARSLRTTFSPISAWSPRCARSSLSSSRLAVLRLRVVAADAILIDEGTLGGRVGAAGLVISLTGFDAGVGRADWPETTIDRGAAQAIMRNFLVTDPPAITLSFSKTNSRSLS